MHDYLRNIVSTHATGLATIQVPTGAGKSYEVAKLIKEMADDPDEHRKIIYLTSLNKNLLDKDLEALYGDDKEQFQSKILRLRANRDEVKEKLLDIKIPEAFQTDKYICLYNVVRKYRSARENKITDSFYMEDLENQLHDAEQAYRKEIEKKLSKEFKGKEKRLYAIHNDEEYSWIGKLYPAVFTDERQVLVMSISKFLKHNSTLVERGYEFLKAKFLDNAVIFIDEFDSTKESVMNDIIDRAKSMKNDYITLFKQIKRSLVIEDMSRDMREAAQTSKGRYKLEQIIAEADEIWDRSHLGLSYKVSETDVDRSQNFLVKDGTFHSILQKGAQYIRTAKAQDENRVLISFEKRKEFFANRKDDDIIIYSVIRDISTFLDHFRLFINNWGKRYAEVINEQRSHADYLGDELSEGSAVSSIMSKLGLSREQQQVILGEMCGAKIKNGEWNIVPDLSFYQRGMEVFSFKDHDDHNDYTELEFVQIFDTPEKILAYLSEKALVLGVSATAELASVIANYDLGYLRNVLGDHYYPMDKEASRRIGDELEEKWAAYSDGRITVNAETIKNLNGFFDIDEVCGEIFVNREIGALVADQIRQMGVDEYHQIRYCNILKTMHLFMEKQDIKSMLYLGMALPQKNSAEMSEGLLHKFEKYIITDLDIKGIESFIYILRSENFDENKTAMLNRLENGEKIYVLSSYQTLGAGQNLQYGVTDKSNYIELVPYSGNGDKRHFSKDFDALYLGDVTNKTVNTLSEDAITPEELYNLLFQIEELYSAGELSYNEMESSMKRAFDAHCGKSSWNTLYKTRSVNLVATGHVLQAVGRLCRTHVKSPNIYLWIDEKLVDSLDTRELNSRILPPEMKAIFSLKKKLGKEYADEEKLTLNTAERISTYGNWFIRQQLSRKWTEMSMALWGSIRNVVMHNPTVSQQIRDADEIIKALYVTAGHPINKYLYSQYSDFSDVTIDFGTDAIAFKNSGRVKHKGEGLEAIVSMVSSDDAKLGTILKYPGMKDYFMEMGYATEFTPDDYIMSPVIFHNIYKGALGEIAGSYILKKERGIELHEIEDPERFEFFDFEMSPDVYVDFKNWKFTYTQDREKTLKEISRKIDAIGAKRVYIINIASNADGFSTTSIDKRIVEIPALIDEDGNIIHEMLDKIMREDYEIDTYKQTESEH